MKRLLPIACALVLGCQPSKVDVSSANHPLLADYKSSQSFTPSWSTIYHPSVHQWNQSINLGNGLTLLVTATGWISGEFQGQFSDESTPRTIGHPGDYVYPCDLRYNASKKLLFAKASGLAGGIERVTVVFEYDVQQRRLLHTYHVAENLLPPDPTPITQRPNP
ncbi:hypothetical protein [Geothrix sp.]|uniref:hypothetical protein n=1 Tax=Geothrix sp. TaxID=1962974 RepID=UPI0025BBECA3|nr:hypothetical protein [Geothrix sp.]